MSPKRKLEHTGTDEDAHEASTAKRYQRPAVERVRAEVFAGGEMDLTLVMAFSAAACSCRYAEPALCMTHLQRNQP